MRQPIVRLAVVPATLVTLSLSCARNDPADAPDRNPALAPREAPLEEDESALCSTPDEREDISDPQPIAIDPTITVSQVGALEDPEAVHSLNELLASAVAPLELPPVPDGIHDLLQETRSQLGDLEGVQDPQEYADLKRELLQPLNDEIATYRQPPAEIDEEGGGGYKIADLFRLPGGPSAPDDPFIDLRVHPAQCQDYVQEQASIGNQRVHRNVELSQVATEKVCLEGYETVTLRALDLDENADPVVYLWREGEGMVAYSDDASPGEAAAEVAYTNESEQRHCVTAFVVNAIDCVAGTVEIERIVESGGDVIDERVLEAQLRTFPVDLQYDADDVDFEVAITRYTELPRSATALPLMLLEGQTMVGFDYDSGVGPAAKVERDALGSSVPTRAIVIGRSIEARDYSAIDAYLDPDDEAALHLSPHGPASAFGDASTAFEPVVVGAGAADPGVPPVQFPAIAPEGRVDLILDTRQGLPHEVDADVDGIGALTEAQLCTCDPANRESEAAPWYTWCEDRSSFPGGDTESEPLWHADTDHDGFTDREEVFGVELDQVGDFEDPERVFRTLALPIIGLDPLHKDVLVELDWLSKEGFSNPHTLRSVATRRINADTGAYNGAEIWRAAFFSKIDELFGEGSVEDLRNPDGLPGLRMHFDVGADPIRSPEAEEEHCEWHCDDDVACLATCAVQVEEERRLHRTRVFGDWGGGGTRVLTKTNDPNDPLGEMLIESFCEQTQIGESCPPGPGKKIPGAYHVAYWAGGAVAPETSRIVFNHHRRSFFRYGLLAPWSGSGGQAWNNRFGAGLGDYVVAHELGHTLDLGHAGHPSWGNINCKPHYFSQMNYAYSYKDGIGFSSPPPGAESSTLNPADFQEIDFPVFQLLARQLDLISNETFRFLVDASELDNGVGPADIDWNLSGAFEAGAHRGPATLCPGPGGGTAYNHFDLLERPELNSETAGAAPSLARVGDRMYAFYVDLAGQLVYRHGLLGPKAEGSCISDELKQPCLEWSAPIEVETVHRVEGVAAAEWDGGLVLAFNENNLSWDCDLRIRYVTAPEPDGTLTFEESGFGRPTECGDLEAVALPADNEGGKVMSVFARNWDDRVLEVHSESPLEPSSWSQDFVVDEAGVEIMAPVSPGVAVWPATDWQSLGSEEWNERATACAVFPEQVGTSEILESRVACRDRASGEWQWKADHVPFALTEKPALAFHVLRTPDGEPLDAEQLPGQLWIAHVAENADPARRRMRLWISTKLERDQPPLDFAWSKQLSANHAGEWTLATAGAGPALLEELQLGALKGAMNFQKAVQFYPLVDGSLDIELRTGNDFQVMESGTCRRIRSHEEYCQSDPAHTRFGY